MESVLDIVTNIGINGTIRIGRPRVAWVIGRISTAGILRSAATKMGYIIDCPLTRLVQILLWTSRQRHFCYHYLLDPIRLVSPRSSMQVSRNSLHRFYYRNSCYGMRRGTDAVLVTHLLEVLFSRFRL